MKQTALAAGVSMMVLVMVGCYIGILPILRDGSNPADFVVMNARVFTSDTQNPWAQAVAVKDQRISYVGNDSGIADYIGPDTRVVDALGNMLVPGFVDVHCHLLWIGALHALMTSVYDVDTLEELTTRIRQYAEEKPDAPFVMGIGWRYDYLPNRLPDKAMADAIISDRPLFLWSYGGHTGWVNSMALTRMQTTNPDALRHLTPELDETTGEMTGVLLDFYAFDPLAFFTSDELGPNTEQEMFAAMTAAVNEALAAGVTTVHDVQIYQPFIPILLRYRDQGGLDKIRARCSYYIHHFALEDEAGLISALNDWKALGPAEGNSHFFLGDSVKIYVEGVFGTHTALMLEPYSDDPANYGYTLWTQEGLNRVTEIVDQARLQVCTHGIGDGGIRMIINAYQNARTVNGAWDSRHRIEHCDLPDSTDWPRMADLGIHAAMHPTHFFGDPTGEAALGSERLARLHPWTSMQQAGIEFGFGSDWSAGPINPLYPLLIASTRLNYKGETNWGPEETISVEDAIRHYTIGSARALKLDNDLGSIEVGKYGDFALFSMDLRDLAAWWFPLVNDLELGGLDGFVTLTVVGGEIVYHKPGSRF